MNRKQWEGGYSKWRPNIGTKAESEVAALIKRCGRSSTTRLLYTSSTTLHTICDTCKNTTPSGEPIPPQCGGDPVCPAVQNGHHVCSVDWPTQADHCNYPKLRWYQKSTRAAGKSKGSQVTKTATATQTPDGTLKETTRNLGNP